MSEKSNNNPTKKMKMVLNQECRRQRNKLSSTSYGLNYTHKMVSVIESKEEWCLSIDVNLQEKLFIFQVWFYIH